MRNPKRYYVYILASISGTLYIGITSALKERVLSTKKAHTTASPRSTA
jgi:predicted GIY-YIG superfamily endonuclease